MIVITEKKIKDFINHFLTSLFNINERTYYNFHANFLSIVKDKKFYWLHKLSYNCIQELISCECKNIYELLFNLIVFTLNDDEFMNGEFGTHKSLFNLIDRIFWYRRIESFYHLNISLIGEIFIDSFRKIIGNLNHGYVLRLKNEKSILHIKIKKIKI